MVERTLPARLVLYLRMTVPAQSIIPQGINSSETHSLAGDPLPASSVGPNLLAVSVRKQIYIPGFCFVVDYLPAGVETERQVDDTSLQASR